MKSLPTFPTPRSTCVLFACSLLALLLSACGKAPQTERPPNVILILADDLGYGDLGCYGQRQFETPHLDQLASEGMRFTQHYSGSPVCAPARCVLMTGKHTGHAYVRGNAQNPDEDVMGQLPLPPEEVTFVKYLKDAGYRTGAFGKWGLGNAGTTGDPLKKGFDTFFGYHDQVLAHNSYPEFLIRNNERVYLDNEVAYQSKELWHKGLGSVSTKKVQYSNDLILEEALGFIRNNQDQPFFLYFPTTIPHDNGEAPVGERFEVPDDSRYQDRDWSADEKSYAALVEHLDGYVGKFQAALDQLEIDDNTIVIFTSDNGPLAAMSLDSNGPLRGHKRDLYEGGIRVPLIVKWPGKVEAGATSEHISAFWDFFPTLCEIAGLPQYPSVDGISFLPELLGHAQQEHDSLYWEFHWWEPSLQAARMDNWKAVRTGPGQALELYNLETDLGETENLASSHPNIVKRMERILAEARTPSKRFPLKRAR